MKIVAERMITLTAFETINKICLPLQKIGIHLFSHDITFGHNKVAILTNNKKLFFTYYKNELPIICTSDEGRILEPGIYFNRYLEQSYQDCAQVLPIVTQKFQLINSIHFLEKEEDCQHFFTFAAKLKETDFMHFVINNMELLKNFIVYYKKEAHDIIMEAKKPKHQILLPHLSNFNHDALKSCSSIIEAKTINQQLVLLHKDTKKLIKLTPQQTHCFKFILQGYTAKEIAKVLNLSYRTVEHYLERIRFVLGCRNSKEIMFYYSKQLNLI